MVDVMKSGQQCICVYLGLNLLCIDLELYCHGYMIVFTLTRKTMEDTKLQIKDNTFF